MTTQLDSAMARMNEFRQFVKECMVRGVDFGASKASRGKDSLLKPGAEKIFLFFNAAVNISTHTTEDIDGRRLHTFEISLVDRGNGTLLGDGVGSASTGEFNHKSGNLHDKDNTVMKMALKRAKVDAALNLVCGSELFTQDLDDMYLPADRDDKADKKPPVTKKPALKSVKAAPAVTTAANGATLSELGRMVSKARGKETTTDFANRVGISKLTLAKLEGGIAVPDLEAVMKVAAATNIPADKIMGLREQK